MLAIPNRFKHWRTVHMKISQEEAAAALGRGLRAINGYEADGRKNLKAET